MTAPTTHAVRRAYTGGDPDRERDFDAWLGAFHSRALLEAADAMPPWVDYAPRWLEARADIARSLPHVEHVLTEWAGDVS